MIPRLLLACALLGALPGCSEIRLQTVGTQEEVLGRTQKVVPGKGVRVRARLDGTRLVLQTTRGCEVVAWERVERREEREPDEELTEELVLLGLGAVPLGVGVGLLVDAANVYEDDRNSRTYNATGPDGAYIAGGVLTSVGGLVALVSVIQLMRVAAAGEERVTTVERRGDVLRDNVQCSGGSEPIRTSVVLQVGGQRLATPGTDPQGHLDVDLATIIPPEVAERAVSVKVLVAEKVVGELDIQPILDRQRQLRRARDAQAWRAADPEACRDAAADDQQACQRLHDYLARFPDGLHAQEARAILDAHARKSEGPVIATEPESELDEATQRAIERAEKSRDDAARTACMQACAKQCTTRTCLDACGEVCQ